MFDGVLEDGHSRFQHLGAGAAVGSGILFAHQEQQLVKFDHPAPIKVQGGFWRVSQVGCRPVKSVTVPDTVSSTELLDSCRGLHGWFRSSDGQGQQQDHED